ncbi:hypothetical protein TIFTF001_012881 [Ficus carica]|uniref:Uncharacterized protein n=1 Tax=Ficus carica TaxID=3494 RepID=A0AA88D432_FICCA|nr:hypothetical protein TIFTF001_012881 [Ficus carica]
MREMEGGGGEGGGAVGGWANKIESIPQPRPTQLSSLLDVAPSPHPKSASPPPNLPAIPSCHPYLPLLPFLTLNLHRHLPILAHRCPHSPTPSSQRHLFFLAHDIVSSSPVSHLTRPMQKLTHLHFL